MKRAALGIGLLVAVISLAGIVYQSVASEIDRQTHTAPGQLIDIGGYRLHVQCAGQGSPTVILEAGLGAWSTHWALIQPSIASDTRVCSYDRAGLGWSDSGPEPRDAEQIATELQSLLLKSGVAGPLVVAGHSDGGLYARMFASRYPDEVVGLVLADPTAPELFDWLPATRSDLGNIEQQARVFQALAPFGLVRVLVPRPLDSELSAYPPRARDDIVALNSVGRQWRGLEAEVEALPMAMAEVARTGDFGARPLIVLSSTESADASADDRQVRYAFDTQVATLSSNSRRIVVQGATHSGLASRPEYAAVTTRAILAVLDAVRAQQPLGDL